MASETGSGGSSTTDGNGYYSIPGVAGQITLALSRSGYDQINRSVTVNAETRFDTTITPTAPAWSREGSGNTVFDDMPRNISRLHIRGVWNGSSGSNFIV